MPHLGLAVLGVHFMGAEGLPLATGSEDDADRKRRGDGNEVKAVGSHHSRGPAFATLCKKCSQHVGGEAGFECAWYLAIFSPLLGIIFSGVRHGWVGKGSEGGGSGVVRSAKNRVTHIGRNFIVGGINSLQWILYQKESFLFLKLLKDYFKLLIKTAFFC
jgi:hypothetical protein